MDSQKRQSADTEDPSKSSIPPSVNQLKSVIIVVGTGAVIFIVAALIWLSGYVGTGNDPFDNPDPQDQKTVENRQASVQDIESELARVEEFLGLDPQASASYDQCYQGQNSFKRSDGYNHRCEYKITRYYGFNDEFREKTLAFEQRLSYYDEYYGPDAPQDFGPDPYLVSNLPNIISGYSKDDLVMSIDFAERDTNNLSFIERAQGMPGIGQYYERKDFVDASKVFETVTNDNNYLLVVSLEQPYFEN